MKRPTGLGSPPAEVPFIADLSDRTGGILQAYINGEKTDVIALEYGVTRSYPRIVARRYGIPPRPLYSRRP
jgi:hypothetical protein